MDNRHRKKNFTPSDDALIRQQPISGVGLQTLESMLRTNREALMRRADQLGVSLDSVMIMTGLSTRERSVAATDSLIRY